MKRLRDPRWALILIFLGIIASVPLIQAVLEMRDDYGIRAFELFSQAPTAPNLRNYERTLEGANWAARLCRPWMQFAQFAWLGDGGDKAVIGRDGWYFFKPGLKYMLSPPETARQPTGANDPLSAIVDFRDQLAARGIQLLVLPVPNKDSIYPDRLTSRAAALRTVLAPRTRELLDQLRAADVEVVDLFAEFSQARRQSEGSAEVPLYLAQDTHWSPAGLELAAKAVARRLTERCWVKAGQVVYGARPARIRRLGDIVRMLQSPSIDRSVPPETVNCAQVVRYGPGDLYKDAAEAEILVLGDSFMRIFQQDEPGSAGFIAHLAKELKQPMMSLVNDGGGSTLVRQELRARPVFLKNKKVVIWEFVERDIGLGIEGWKKTPLGPVAEGSR